MDTATKTGIDSAKTVSKRAVQETAEATGDLIADEIKQLIKLLHQVKQNVKKMKRNKRDKKSTQHQKKGIKLLITCFRNCIKMEYQKITNVLGTTLDEVPRFITKNGQKFMMIPVVLMIDKNQISK